MSGADEKGDAPRRRRARYRGTHPRRFEERYKELDPERWPAMQEHVRARGATPAGSHVPILVAEILECLAPRAGEIAVDCTLGHGGHTRALLERLGPEGRLLGLDVDAEELARTRELLQAEIGSGRVFLRHSSYAGLASALAYFGLAAADIVLADLGISSMQVDDPRRGFSFKYDGPLDMRMDARRQRTAADLLLHLSQVELERGLRELADEPDAAVIAQHLVALRAHRPLRTTHALRDAVLEAKGFAAGYRAPPNRPGGHPAARTFQALRLLVNDELGALRELLRIAPACLRPGGRLAILSFHSGEDRLVKECFERDSQRGLYGPLAPPVGPSVKEVHTNPRSRSAKLRWALRTAAEQP